MLIDPIHVDRSRSSIEAIAAVPPDLWGGRLALRLLGHRAWGAASPFHPYVAALPVGFATPLFFSAAAVAVRVRERVCVRERIRLKHYSLRTEEAYVDWVRRFVFFHGRRHPGEMAAPEVEAFLTHLADSYDHDLDQAELPPSVSLAWDGLQVELAG